MKTLLQEYENLWAAVGPDRFDKGVSNILHEGKYQFFPSIAEFRGFIPAKGQWKPCNIPPCEEGFVRVPDYEARRMYGNEVATKMVFHSCRYGSSVGGQHD